MATERALVLKHYRNLVRNITSFTNGQAYMRMEDGMAVDDDLLDVVNITIAPSGGPYQGGKFDFELDLSDGYPSSPPTVKCNTQVYHPNIDWCDNQGDVCLNLLDELWTADMSLEDVVQGLLFLFYNPNIEDPLNSMFTGVEAEDDFLENVRMSLRGEEVDGIQFDKNLVEESESEVDDTDAQATMTSIADESQGSTHSELNTQVTVETSATPEGKCIIESDADKPLMNPVELRTSIEIESSVDRDDFGPSGLPQQHIITAAIYKVWTSVWQYAHGFRIMSYARLFTTELRPALTDQH